jgi:hypothetical protein
MKEEPPKSSARPRFDAYAEPETPRSLINEPPEKSRAEKLGLRLVVGGKEEKNDQCW